MSNEISEVAADLRAISKFAAPTILAAVAGLLLIAYAGTIGLVLGLIAIAVALVLLFLPRRWN